ncbi:MULTISPECIES: lipocalin-like domain-containing protein [unclassified Staphylococcus]|uniref:lipocalin-like domain-containing protein n=1 Tax=unclassified Staphylococcus TaxID=91994 RepID=UPI00187F6243|nr:MULTISPECIES: lipocalin-like domain-containing protein [unclassified Staphylococcus]MBF2756420.1 lipocalin-like domain-containing protein [Staphylococcus haemolyticus]MBF2773667.1 lipocalin-like domain-containing protein [Staphylococcus haemolyticus]MBF2775784.1 lipocalin-like domain-containing protein [Staphylococcus haemolyticus]MBF2815353.1 lipocalin-like domain-containing protein [Staphylococcus haemolyticus]MBF9719874.1 lipocalin-like domain-containing protein [Staphylococcus haemolyti
MAELKEQLIGTWKLVRYQDEDKDGNIFFPLGKDATGFIMYNPDGYMSAQLMQQGRQAYESGDLHTGTQDEMAEAAHGYVAYSGRFELDEENSTVYHTMEVSMNPTWLGDTQPRLFELEGDTLSIVNGNVPNQKLVWQRVQ